MNNYQPRAPHPGRTAVEPCHTTVHATSCNTQSTRGEGMRRGEALGLKWSDLRLDEGELDIDRTLGLVVDRLVVGDQKTEGGRRIVSLDPATVAALRQHRTEQVQERLLIGPGSPDEDWVFSIARRPSHASAPGH